MVVGNEVVARFGMDPQRALASGTAERVKVQGRWLYLHPEEPGIEEMLDRAAEGLEDVLGEWLISSAQYVVGQVIRADKLSRVSPAACRVLLHELCHRQRLDGIALMTRSLQPHLAFHLRRDDREIERQVAAMRELLSRRGAVTWRCLPEPLRLVPRQAWRTVVLDHGRWLGLGHQPEQGMLEAW